MFKQLKKIQSHLSFAIALLFVSTQIAAETPPVNGDFSTSSLCFNMDACSAYETQGTNFDYSEFVPVVTNSSTCLQMSSTGVYRDEPLRNPHSCTPGVNGSTGICISSVMDCNYPAGHMRSLKIDVQVTPGSDGSGMISSLSFFEQAPANYNWINGPSGANNYPTLYGVRVLKDGSEIWRSTGNTTTNDWTLESFSFLNDPAFTVTQASVFTFEFIGYCLVGNGALVNAWDLDEIKIESSCGTVIDGGSLALPGGGTTTSACVGTGASAPINVVVSGNQGPSGAYIITDENGVILDLPAGNPPFDFGGAGEGVCLIWYASYDGNLTGLSVGSNASDIQGCFNLSNPVQVDRYTASGGTVTAPGGGDICAGGNNMIDVSVSGSVGTGRWVITDTSGNIIGLPSAPPFDLSVYNLSECIIWHIGYQGNINGLTVGSNANNLTGTCFGLSNPINVAKVAVNGGVLESNGVTYINLCEGNGSSNVIDIQVNGSQGTNSQIVLTDSNGNIIDANPTFPYDFSGSNPGLYTFYNVSWLNNLTGLSAGQNINNLDGFCFDLSNAVTIDKEQASGGTISSPMGSNFEICIEGVVSDPIDISLSGSAGEFSRWLITDPNGNIIALPNDPPFLLDPTVGGTCVIWHLGFESSFRGLFIGQNVSEFDGCYGLSNGITVTKRSSSGGVISQGGFTYIDICGVNGSQTINVDIYNNFGANSQYVVSDENGNIVALSSTPNIDFSSYGNGSYTITHVSYYSGVSGLAVGGNLANVTADCIDFSNEITVNKYNPAGGTISSPQGGTINVCNDGVADMIEATVTGNTSGFSRWVVTDTNGNIVGLPNNPPFSFEQYPDGTCLLWHLSYENGIGGLTLGGNANSFTGCFSLSNSITINKQSIGAGTLDINGQSSVAICLEDNLSDEVTVNHTGQDTPNGTFVITDEQGNILEVAAGPTFDFGNAPAGVCRVYFVGYDNITGLSAGGSISGLGGCYAVSNFVTVYRSVSSGGQITTDNGTTEVSVCVGDGFADLVNVNLFGSTAGATDQWVITDAAGNIVALPGAPPFDFDGAGTGVCYIWNINYGGNITGLDVGANVSGLVGCYSLSNSIVVNRYDFDSSASSSTLLYNLDACSALTGSTQFDYTEFTPIINNDPSCTQLSAGTVYRNDPMQYPHSCTAGVNGSTALCVSSYDNCTYEANNPHSLRFDVTVTPSGNGTATLNTLSFYEAAPLNFQWISGTSGPNNYPTQYGIRVMKDGNEVFRQTGIATTNSYTLENFDFSSNPEFTVTSPSVFSFELLGYCLVGLNGATATAWDVDDIRIVSNCSGGLNGGELSINGGNGGTSMEVCADDGIDDLVNLNLLNAAGPNMAWVITDTDGTIIALPTSQPFNFEGAGGGTCLIWNLSFITGLQGASVGLNANDLQGCYSLSNPITIIRKTGAECTSPRLSGGLISSALGFTQQSYCVNDGISDLIDVQLTGNEGEFSSWLVTDENNMIVDIPSDFPYDFEGTSLGRAVIYHVAYNGELANMLMGNTLDMLEGEYDFSNPILIDRTDCAEVSIEITEDYPSDFSLFPNPSNNLLTIKNDVPSKYGSVAYIFDTFGKLVGTYKIKGQSIQVNVSQFSEGFYYIKMIAGENESSRSFTKL